MLSTSLRRAARAPIVPVPGITRSSGPNLAATRRIHQRHYSSSSSKPPVPPSDGSSRMDTSAPAKGVNSSGEKGKAARRRGKDSNARSGSSKSNQQHMAFSKLPSVPSTQHQQPHDVHLASFFSIHRPISVTTTVPPASSAAAFDAIFSSKRSLKNDPEDVIFTLSSAVQSMENPGTNAESDESFNQLHRNFTSDYDGEVRMAEGVEAKMSVEEFARRLRPFNPPPPPTAMNSTESAPDAMESSETQNSPETSTYSTVLTIRESRHADGRKTYEAHTGPLVCDDSMDAPSGSSSGTTYMERLRQNRTMHTLSTKRRRRVKMKKHKFKKLMKRTRTLRRKHDKL